jgi:hypothetical protein
LVRAKRLTNHKKVILFQGHAPPKIWSFFDFGYLSGGKPIETWYEAEISDRARFSFDGLVKNNEKIANHVYWSGLDKHMHGELKGKGVWQWRISGELAYRMLGAFWGQKRAVFLMGYYHKGDVYTPPNALTTALDRKKMLDKGACKLYERQAEDNF